MTMNRFNFFAIMPLIAALMACGQTVPGGMGIDPNEQPNASLRAQASNATYYLPWTSGRRFQVTQGYSGGYSHGGSYALDFGLFQGDEVRSARAGEVISVISGRVNCFKTGCPSGDGGFGNYVQVYHSDDTNTLYAHLSSSAVSVGQRVNQGQLLGFAGSTGYSTAAHLHFQANNGRSWSYASTFAARFKEVSDAGNSEPVDGVSYTSQNNEITDETRPSQCNPGWTPGGTWTRQISDNDLDLSEGQGFQKLGLYPQYWWADGSNGSGGNSIYTYSGNVPDENFGKWSTYVPEGTYDAYAYIPTAVGNADNIGGSSGFADEVKYKVQGFDGPIYNVASINQSANRGCWVKLGTGYGFTQGLRVAVQLGDQVDSTKNRRIYFDDVAFYKTSTPAKWDVNPKDMTFRGTIGGVIASQGFTISNIGGATGTFSSFSTDDSWLGARDFALTVAADASTNGQAIISACTAVGTVTGELRFGDSGSNAIIKVTRICDPAASSGNGTGLMGEYWNTTDFTGPRAYSGVDGYLNIGWGTGAPNASVNPDNFSVRWTGQIQPKYSGEWTFHMQGDDGVRLYVNNQLVVDHWVLAGLGTEYTGKITLTAGQKYDIKLELFEGGGAAGVVMQWSHQYQAKEVVPATQLYPAVATMPKWTLNPTALQFNGTVGTTPATKTFTITNTGGVHAVFGMGSSNDSLVTSTGYSTSLAVNASTTATVIVSACTSVGTTTGQLVVGGGGGSNAAIAITRVCDAALPPAPSTPSPSSITMSSNGRIFIAWPEVSGATQYDFQATFGGAAISVTGQAPNRGGVNGSAVATFLSAPDAADKQGKQVCFSIRASNTGGSSTFSSFACTTYKYYAGGLTVQSSSDVPRLTLK
jgi:hypothetical protein